MAGSIATLDDATFDEQINGADTPVLAHNAANF